ncbi:MAG: phage tail-collar fiber domain-containing protein [Halomonas sp.]|uniref:phage tail-collar fiber domain-containing protein n=1 Tax=Halomonas sp. TaxID=1486246 RepID=UPI003F92C0EE
MAEYYTTLTNIGADKVAAAMSGGPALHLAQMAAGDGGGASFYDQYERATLKQRTHLVNQRWADDLNLVDQDPHNPAWVITEGLIPTQVGGWYIREVGVFDIEGDLIAIGVYPETYKPVATAVEADLLIRSILEVGDAASVELKIDPSQVFATRAWVVDVAIPKALTILDDKVDEADSHADRAEIARDGAFVNADVYDDVPAGLASGDEQFQVIEGDEIVRYRRIDASNAEPVARYPAATQSLTQGWRGALDAGIGIERRIGDNPHSYTQTLAGGGPENRPPLSLSVQGVGSTGSTYRLNAPGIVARREMINVLANSGVMRVDILTGNPDPSTSPWDGDYRAGVAWYRSNRNPLSDEPISIAKIDSDAGDTNSYDHTFTFGPEGSGADVEAPSAAVYAVPFFEVTSTTGRFFASRLEVKEISLDNTLSELQSELNEKHDELNESLETEVSNLDATITTIGSEALTGTSVVNLFRDGSDGAIFDFTNPLIYEEKPHVGEIFHGAKSLIGQASLRTVIDREVIVSRLNSRLFVYQPLDADTRHPLIADEPLLMQWPCTLVFSVQSDNDETGRLPVFFQHGTGEEGRVQITLNGRYTGSSIATEHDRLQVFIDGITDGSGVDGQPRLAEAPRGTVVVGGIVLKEGYRQSELWVNHKLVDRFTAPPVIYQTNSYLMGHPSLAGFGGLYYGRFLTINRALSGSEFEQACEWATGAFGENWQNRTLVSNDLLTATSAISLLVPTSGVPESAGRYDTVTTLYAKGLDETLKPASVTKVMTSMVMLDYVDDLQGTIQMQDGDQTGGSGNNLSVGDVITYYDALHNMLLPSSNVTTTVVARTVGQIILDQEESGGDPVERFIQAMNDKAQQLGMYKTHFTNASGLNNDAMVTTAKDLAHMGISALAYPDIVSKWGKPSYTFDVQGDNPRSVSISHSIDMIDDDDVMGGKTGTLGGSNRTRNLLLLSRMPGGNFVISVVMLTSADDRYLNMRNLLDYVRINYRWPSSYLLTG